MKTSTEIEITLCTLMDVVDTLISVVEENNKSEVIDECKQVMKTLKKNCIVLILDKFCFLEEVGR